MLTTNDTSLVLDRNYTTNLFIYMLYVRSEDWLSCEIKSSANECSEP